MNIILRQIILILAFSGQSMAADSVEPLKSADPAKPAELAKTTNTETVKQHYLGSRFDDLSEYQGSFRTLGEVLDELEGHGFISQAEKSNVVGFLQDQGPGTEYKVTEPEFSGRTMRFGESSLIVHSNGNLRTSSGKVLTFGRNESLEKVFKEIFLALLDREKIKEKSQSEAQEIVFDIASAAFTSMFFASTYRPMNLVCEAKTIPVLKYMVEKKSRKTNGIVSCKGKAFVANWAEDIDEIPPLRKSAPCRGENCLFEANNPEVVTITEKLDCSLLDRVPNLVKEQTVSMDDVRAALNIKSKDKTVDCSPDLARRVEVYTNVQVTKLDRQLKKFLQTHASSRISTTRSPSSADVESQYTPADEATNPK